MIFPVHPRTLKMLKKFKLLARIKRCKNIKITEPIGYLDMICLEKSALKIITDSGGVQKESYFFKIPCVTLRDRTEWTETLKNGWNTLTGTDIKKILRASETIMAKKPHPNYYGTGQTSEKIVNIIINRGIKANGQSR